MVKITKNIVPASVAKSVTFVGANQKRYITVHETDNTSERANADAHGRLQANGNSRTASWHYSADDKQIVQSFSDNARCMHAGDGLGDGNMNSIAIEICVNSDGVYKKAVENAAELTRYLMKKHGIPASNVVQHNRWSGKNCPRHLRAGDWGVTWGDFMAMVGGSSGSSVKPPKPTKTPPKPQSKPYTKDAKYPKLGNYGSNVLTVQKALNKAGYKVAKDSSFGPATDKAVRAFQRAKGLAVDGQAGPATQAALKKAGKPSKASPNLTVDGSWGPATTRALQRHFGTSVDGVISGQPNNRSTRNIPSAKYGTSGSNLVRAMQRRYGTTVDGKISGTSSLIKAMQRSYKSTVDGYVSNPSNLVRAMQRRLNEGKRI